MKHKRYCLVFLSLLLCLTALPAFGRQGTQESVKVTGQEQSDLLIDVADLAIDGGPVHPQFSGDVLD